jgi:hypothetical protein
MLNISSTTPVSWPTPVSTAVAPVSPVSAVQPVQAGGNDAKTQMGFGRDGRAAQPHTPDAAAGSPQRAAADGAPSLPAEAAGAPAPPDPVAQRKLKQEAAQAAEQARAKDKQAVEHLQSVLSRMWEASAAVVGNALGIEPPKGSELPGTQSDTAPDLSAVAASLIPRKLPVPERAARSAPQPLPLPDLPGQSQVGGGAEAVQSDAVAIAEPMAAEQVVAYDEHGNSSLAPLEAGSLISERV